MKTHSFSIRLNQNNSSLKTTNAVQVMSRRKGLLSLGHAGRVKVPLSTGVRRRVGRAVVICGDGVRGEYNRPENAMPPHPAF